MKIRTYLRNVRKKIPIQFAKGQETLNYLTSRDRSGWSFFPELKTWIHQSGSRLWWDNITDPQYPGWVAMVLGGPPIDVVGEINPEDPPFWKVIVPDSVSQY